MKRIIKKIIRYAGLPFILKDFISYKKKVTGKREFELNLKDVYPCVKDKTITTGFDRHYVFHTAWAARKIQELNPKVHTDISSSLYFCTIVSAFIPVDFYDYRPAPLNLSGLKSLKGDLMNLPFDDSSLETISCMHTIEHIGLWTLWVI